MSLRELAPGQSHTFASAPLAIEVTGPYAAKVRLVPVDQAGTEVRNKRSRPGAVLLTPRPQRLRLVVRPIDALRFPAAVTVGLSLRSEGNTSTSVVELVVPAIDVGALEEHVLAVLEFAPSRTVLTVAKAPPKITEDLQDHSVVGDIFTDASEAEMPPGASDPAATDPVGGASGAGHVQSPAPPAPPAQDEAQSWLNVGRYAFREAEQLPGRPATSAPPAAWSLVLDGSVSMRELHDAGQLDRLIGLVCGVMVEWVQVWASAAVVAGATAVEMPLSASQPHELTRSAYARHGSPSSWSTLAEATEVALRRTGPQGGVLLITDGPPADLQRLVEVTRGFPDAVIAVIVVATSAQYGLPSDQVTQWWREELGAVGELTTKSRARVAALVRSPSGGLELGGTRAAELASRLISEPAGVRA